MSFETVEPVCMHTVLSPPMDAHAVPLRPVYNMDPISLQYKIHRHEKLTTHLGLVETGKSPAMQPTQGAKTSI